MLYEVRVEDQGSFEYVSDEPLKVGELITELSTVYEVTRLLDRYDKFDAVAEAEWRAGPATTDDD